MKKLMTTIVMASTLLMTSNMTWADEHSDKKRGMNPPTVEKVLERMTKRLNLTKEQQQNIKPVIEENMKKRQELREERKNKIESYLTDEQKEKLAAKREHRKDRKKDCRKGDERR